MPSFDIVSEINQQEVDNAINQTLKEVITRYDFKGSKSTITKDKDGIRLVSDNESKMKALIEMLQHKMVKRGVSLKSLDHGKIEEAGGMTVRCLIKLINGIATEKAKELVKKIKGLDMKVQAAIEGEKLRVSGKKRDDLQDAIQALKTMEFSLPLEFTNFRD